MLNSQVTKRIGRNNCHTIAKNPNASWIKDETWAFIKKYDITYTIVDEPLLPPEEHLTTDFEYFRWHGKGERIWFDYRYSKEELDSWVPKVQQASKSVKKVIGFFNNHYHSYAPENCLYMLQHSLVC